MRALCVVLLGGLAAGCGGAHGAPIVAATTTVPSASSSAPVSSPAVASASAPVSSPAPVASSSPGAPVSSASAPAFVPAGTQLPTALFDLPAGYLAGGGDPVRAPTRLEADTFTDRAPGVVPAFLRVVSWNVRWGEDALAVERALTSVPELLRADVVLLQEVPRGDPASVPAGLNLARHLAQVLRMDYVLAGQWDWTLVSGKAGEHGVAILSKYPLGNVTTLRHTAAHDWFAQERRVGGFMSLGADALVGGQLLRLYATHLEVRGAGGGRARQARELRQDADLPGRPARQVVGGDLNTWLHAPVALLLSAEPLVPELLAAGWLDGLPGYAGPTQLGAGFFPQRLDWLFLRGVTPLGGACLRRVRGSDHLPIYVDLLP